MREPCALTRVLAPSLENTGKVKKLMAGINQSRIVLAMYVYIVHRANTNLDIVDSLYRTANTMPYLYTCIAVRRSIISKRRDGNELSSLDVSQIC